MAENTMDNDIDPSATGEGKDNDPSRHPKSLLCASG